MTSVFRSLPIISLLFLIITPCQAQEKTDLIRQEILTHGKTIRDAFAAGDIAAIKALHHPEVIKALGYTNVQEGREAVIAGVAETLQNFSLEFIENEVENILIQENLAIEQTRFAIKGTPRAGGDSFIFRGRTMVTYLRYAESPTGWATIREIIQPATD